MPSPEPFSRRRFIAAAGCLAGASLVVGGCSSSRPKKASRSTQKSRRPKGPKTMGDLLVGEYISDLQKGPADKQITAARELGNMGSGASKAIPALEAAAKAGDAKVREAAQKAISEIRK